MLCFHFSLRILLISLFYPLVEYVNLYVFVNFIVFQISSFIPLWPEKVLSITSVFFTSEACFVACRVVCPGDVLCAPERGACSAELVGVFCIHLLRLIGV